MSICTGFLEFFILKYIEHVSVGGSVVEFSPATRETVVRFPANAKRLGHSRYSFPLPPEYDSIFVVNLKIVGNKEFLPCGLVVTIWYFHHHGAGINSRHGRFY